ncbi:hypothetical protein B1992_14365 [Pseudoxanthomonas broegbernensis]|uniref:UbiA family prenyltransferase n=1 Tax=Pseudoxanthomonas broegbernensis TaxID=83619 RepID=A0A7V8GK44_9GAMM|nr:UbiA family prenyltransferase [Pseudoxanthomonas broegbernensis]KAF1684818.1 hypothetical protein B1992_14365 [Pseudoxanthomonas broegbernensis]
MCVDLDGTLLHGDMLYETVFALLKRNPLLVCLFPFWLLRGKAYFKAAIASRVSLDVALMSYDGRVLDHLRATQACRRVLCTASDVRVATAVAEHLGVFDEVLASDGVTNLGGRAKARALVERFGEGGFDYFGNHRFDLHVWRHARRAWVVNGSRSLLDAAARVSEIGGHLPREPVGALVWAKALRLHQWLKNLLVFVPLLAAHQFLDAASALKSTLAFLAFGLCASGVYVLNDLLDLQADRQHPRKRNRAFASGRIPILHGMLIAPLSTVAGFALAWWVAPNFAAVLGVYWLTTVAYSLWLKRVEMLDVMVLAGLYTLRIIGGAVAISVPLSFWLLAFSMFVFLSLAILKRYTELAALAADGRDQASGRGYATTDLPLLQSLGGASGYIAVLVLALYINSPDSVALYARPKFLWLLCPLLLYWVSRAWSVAHRGKMHDDPVVFAVTDPVSQAVAGLCALAVLGAI